MARRTAFLITCVALVLSATAFIRAVDRAPDPYTQDREGLPAMLLYIEPIPGLTLESHLAPPEISVPLGIDLRFRQIRPDGAVLNWSGADELSSVPLSSIATFNTSSLGRFVIEADVRQGTHHWNNQCAINVVDVPADQIRVIEVRLSVLPFDLTEGASNVDTMQRFFHDSIAPLERLREHPRDARSMELPGKRGGVDRYRTSVDRLITLDIRTKPPGFGGLMEIDLPGGRRKLLSDGPINFEVPGKRSIQIGPPMHTKEIEIETYQVTIVGHDHGDGRIPEGVDVTFTAFTDPPGYEDEITWLSSTKYGTAKPVWGRGPMFTVQFDDTVGVDDGFQWLGVKADNAIVNEDNNRCTSDVDCNDGQACNGQEHCDIQTGACDEGMALPDNAGCSDDGNQCTNDVCQAGACTHPNKPNNTSCSDDGNQCTNDFCQAGACTHPNKPNGTACDNGDECATDRCQNGACAPATACANNGDPAPGGNENIDKVITENSEPVYLFSGEYYLEREDLRIPGRGFDFVWARKYRSRELDESQPSAQGVNWDFSYNRRVEFAGVNRIVHDGDSRRDVFVPAGSNLWTSPGFFRELTLELDGTYVLTFPDMLQWIFRPLDGSVAQGRIQEIKDRNGNRMTFDYDPAGRLIKIYDTLHTVLHPRDVTIEYNSDGFIEFVRDWVGRQVQYEYYQNADDGGSFGDLKSVTYPIVENTPDFPIPPGHQFEDGKTWTYTYSENTGNPERDHNLRTITDGRGQTYLTITYSSASDPASPIFDRVVSVQYGSGSYHYVYVGQTPSPANNFATTKTIAKDRVGNVEELFYDAMNRLVLRREFTGRANPDIPTTEFSNRPTNKLRAGDPDSFTTSYEYDADSLLIRKVLPNGNSIEYTYDVSNPDPRARGNLLQERCLPGGLGGDQTEILQSYTYDPDFNFVATHTNGRGFTTTYTHDPVNGDLLQIDHPTVTLGVLGGGSQPIVDEYEYNAFGQMTRHVHPGGRVDEFTYHPSGFQLGYLENEIIDAPGFTLTTTKTYDKVGNVRSVTDPRGNTEQYIYNQLNQIVRHISKPPFSYETDSFYDDNNNLIRVDVQNVDDQGVLQTNTHLTTTYEYDILDNRTRMTREVDPSRNIVTEYEYDNNQNQTLIRYGEATNGTQPRNVVRTLYDERDLAFRRIRAESDPAQSTTQYDYDPNENKVTERVGLEATPRIHTYAYDGFDRPVTVADPMGNLTTVHYDANGNRTSSRNDGEITDLPGNTGNVRLSESTFSYDEVDRLFRIDAAFFEPPAGTPIADGFSTTRKFYNPFSQIIRIEDDNAHVTDTVYDTANRRSVVTDAKLNTTTYSYDANSNITGIVEREKSDLINPDQSFTTTSAYDSLDRRIQTIDNVGNTNAYDYDSRGNRTVTVDALNHETRYTYDGLNRLTATTRDLDGDGADGNGSDIVTTQAWDDTSRLISQADDNGNATRYAFDALNRRILTRYADGTLDQVGIGAAWPNPLAPPELGGFGTGFDVHDNKTTMADANGSIATATYDLLNRQTGKSINPAAGVLGTTAESYQYDGLSRLVRAEDDDSIVTREYDSLGHVTSETLTVDTGIEQTIGTLVSTFDGVGNKMTCTYPGGREVTRTYDPLDRAKMISDAGGTIAEYDYIGPSRVERREYGNGTQADYAYDGITGMSNPPGDFGVRRIIGTTHQRISDMTVLDQRTFTWDRMYNKTQRKDIRAGGPELTHDYSYDAIYRLTHTTVTAPGPITVRDTDYDFDGVGNRTTVVGDDCPGPYTLDPTTPEPTDSQVNQYTTTPCNAREYDDNGNLTLIDDPPSGGPTLTNVSYDYRNQMVVFNDVTDGVSTSYAYDALGRRIQKIVDDGGAPIETRFFYDGWQEIEEQDDNGATLATYVFGLYIDEALTMRRDTDMLGGPEDYYYHTDDLYNVVAVSDSTGFVVERYEFQDYGRPEVFDAAGTPVLESQITNPILFTGRRFDPESAWYYFRTRYLDPIAGRFTTRDTIGIWTDHSNLGNASAYVSSNPWTYLDPLATEKPSNDNWFRRNLLELLKLPFRLVSGEPLNGNWAGEGHRVDESGRSLPPLGPYDEGAMKHDFGYDRAGRAGISGALNPFAGDVADTDIALSEASAESFGKNNSAVSEGFAIASIPLFAMLGAVKKVVSLSGERIKSLVSPSTDPSGRVERRDDGQIREILPRVHPGGEGRDPFSYITIPTSIDNGSLSIIVVPGEGLSPSGVGLIHRINF